jgi:hypothetical protein
MPEPTSVGYSLLAGYSRWKDRNPYVNIEGKSVPSNSGDYMKIVYSDRYQNSSRDTARRTFNKITSGESSGRNLSLYNVKQYEPPKYLPARVHGGRRGTRTFFEYGPTRAKSKRYGAARITGEEAIYRVVVYYYYDEHSFNRAVDTNGVDNQFGDSRSFNAYTNKHYTREDRPLVMSLIIEAVDDRMLTWEENSPPKQGYIATRIEVTQVPAAVKGTPVALDEMTMEDYELGEDGE